MLPRVADAAVDLDAFLGDPLARRRPPPWPSTWRSRRARRPRRSSTRRSSRAHGPARAGPAGRRACAWSPGTTRSARRTARAALAYSTEMSNACCAVPTHSSASATVASCTTPRSAIAVPGPGDPRTRSAVTTTSPSVTVARIRLWSSAAIGATSNARGDDERADPLVADRSRAPEPPRRSRLPRTLRSRRASRRPAGRTRHRPASRSR